ncbi:karyopherin [Rhizina undulata]
MNGGGDPGSIAGTSPAANGSDSINGQQPLHQIKQALQIVYDPHSSNDSRKQAGAFLETAKNDKEAPYHGFTLAIDRSHDAMVRHFGLLLLEHAIRYYWVDYTIEESALVKSWILMLAENVKMEGDPVYLRNKVALLWVEIAKRSWGSEWLDMDELLVKLWDNSQREGNFAQRDLVLSILETLGDDVFNREDSVAGLRNSSLSKACIDIFTPDRVLQEFFPGREPTVARCGEEGWLIRLVKMLDTCLESGLQGNAEVESCAMKVLGTLKVCMSWAIPKAIAAAKVVEAAGRALMVNITTVQMVATECLHTLFSRVFFEDDDFEHIICPMYHAQTVQLLKNIFESIRVDPNDIDEEKYLFVKKFSEMMANLASFVEEKPTRMPQGTDLVAFMRLLFAIASHDSLAVSIPVLNAWTRILRKEYLSESEAVLSLISSLLELTTSRLIRYEVLNDESNPNLLFLNEDLDTIPERHAFLGNYRRFCQSIIESMVRRRPFEAFPFILGQVDRSIANLNETQPPFSLDQYQKNLNIFLQVDAQFTVVDAALKGYMKWIDSLTKPSALTLEPVNQENQLALEGNLEKWCEYILNIKFDDPMIKRRVIQLMVTFSTTALDKKADLMLKILEHILLTRPAEYLANHAYTEAVKELMNICTTEIQRLAMKMPDHLMLVYEQLQNKINEIVATQNVDDRTRIAFHTFLFTINHRTKNIDPQLRQTRLESYIHPVREGWQDMGLTDSLQSFEGFCRVLGLDKVQEYLISRRVHEISDFTKYQLDAEGQTLQNELTEKFRGLPIRTTKAFLAVSTEKLRKPSNAYNISCALWHDTIPMILPNLLKFLSHAHGFHNPQNWAGLPQEFQSVVRRILTDRFWQAGISTGSRDEFYENVTKTKSTMEGLASSIRGAIRMVRESCYSILWCMSRLDVHFYGLEELPGPLALSLFADAHALSSHQMSILLNMTRYIIDDCPTTLRVHFLTPLLASLFTQVDRKISGEWNELIERGQISLGDDKLAEEMKEESILRQLTYTAVLIVAGLLDPQRPGEAPPVTGSGFMSFNIPEMQAPGPGEQSMRDFILSSDSVLEPLILFCTHALRMRDSRCCGIIIRVFRSIVPEFQADRADIREFICREVLMAAIDSLHEDYFVDVQKDFAQLIATIFLLYSPTSQTPRSLLLTLPGITENKVDNCHKRMMAAGSTRHQRALILELLDGLRGVAMSEKGKLPRASKQRAQVEKDKKQQQYTEKGRESPDLGGVADMFA